MKLDRKILSGFVYNAGGVGVPLLAAIVTVPPYLHALGEERYGILALVWLMFGYFGLFDMGLSRATVHRMARIPRGQGDLRETVFRTAVTINLGLGVLAAVLFYAAANVVLLGFIGDARHFEGEIPGTLVLVALLFPLALVANVFVGRLESEERFFVVNLVQMSGALLMQLLPLVAVLLFAPRLDVAVAGALVGRVATAAMLLGAVARVRGRVAAAGRFDWEEGKDLLRFGGWVTVTNGISPLLVSIDQFLIGYMLGGKAIAYYAIPFNMAMKVLILPSALSKALFPRLSRLGAGDARGLAVRSVALLSGVLAMVCAPAILLTDVLLTLWIDPGFAAHAGLPARLLLVGTFVNGLAFVAFSHLQGQGRADLVAKFHLVEFVPFVVLVVLMIQAFGLPGAAAAWVLRVAVDAGLLFSAVRIGWMTIVRALPQFALVAAAFAASSVLALTPVEAFAVAVGAGLMASAVGVVQYLNYPAVGEPVRT